MNRPIGVRSGKWECSTEKTIFGQKLAFFVPPFADICLVLYAWNENTGLL